MLLFYFFIFKFIYLYDLCIEEQGEEGNGTPGIIIYSSANITFNFQNNFTNKWRKYGQGINKAGIKEGIS